MAFSFLRRTLMFAPLAVLLCLSLTADLNGRVLGLSILYSNVVVGTLTTIGVIASIATALKDRPLRLVACAMLVGYACFMPSLWSLTKRGSCAPNRRCGRSGVGISGA
jgi:hypothetical protein